MTYSSRFFLYGPLGLFLALAAGVMIHWWFAAEAFSRRLDALNGHDLIPGVTMRFASKTISGFPFRLDAVFTRFEITGAAPHGGFSWTSDEFALHSLTYGRTQDIFEAAGNQVLSWVDGEGRSHRLAFLPASLRASASADENGLSRFDLDVIGAGGKDTGGAAFTAGRAQFHLRRDPDGETLDLMLSADEVKDAGGIAPLFGDRIQKLRLYAKFTHPSALAELLAGRTSWPKADAAWREAKGGVLIGPVDIASRGLGVKAGQFDMEGGLGALLDPLY